jgi:hypothetical protein
VLEALNSIFGRPIDVCFVDVSSIHCCTLMIYYFSEIMYSHRVLVWCMFQVHSSLVLPLVKYNLNFSNKLVF